MGELTELRELPVTEAQHGKRLSGFQADPGQSCQELRSRSRCIAVTMSCCEDKQALGFEVNIRPFIHGRAVHLMAGLVQGVMQGVGKAPGVVVFTPYQNHAVGRS